jgi:hypothetical protein
MDGSQHSIVREANGRFRPGCSGNPAGKKPGTRNRATILREHLADGEEARLARIVIDKALAGDAVTARFLLDRLEPKPRGRPIQLELPGGESAAGDVVALFNSALRAMAAGVITPDEAVLVSRFLEGRFRVLRAWQLEEKLTRWNKPLPIPGDEFVPEGTAERVKSPLRPNSPLCPTPTNFASPPTNPPHISSPPAARGERVAQGWRAKGEPYPELGEGGAEAAEMPDNPDTPIPPEEKAPHPAPAKLDDVSRSLRNPLPASEGEGDSDVGCEPDVSNHDDLLETRRRLLRFPWLRDIAQSHGLLRKDELLHSACNFEAPPLPLAAPLPPVTPAPRVAPSRSSRVPRVILRRPR